MNGLVKFATITLASLIIFAGLSTPAFAQQSAPICSPDASDTCEVENFSSATTGGKGKSWMSPNDFSFGVINDVGGSPELGVLNLQNLGNSLVLACNTTTIELPEEEGPYSYVSLLLKGNIDGDGWFDIMAVDGSGNIIDQAIRFNAGDHSAEAVYLGPFFGRSPRIHKIVIHMTTPPGSGSCSLDCTDAFLAEIQACDAPVTVP